MASTATNLSSRAVRIGFEGARLPLSLAKRAGLDIERWPPVVAYEAVEAQAKKLFGRALGDKDLLHDGEMQADAAAHRARAIFLSEQAETLSERAAERLDERSDRVEDSRQVVEERTDERRAEIEREEREARREVRQREKARDAAVKKAARTRQKAVEAKERQAQLTAVESESKALDKEKEAVEAEAVVTSIDEHLSNGS